jgi:hypothetical protein
VFGLGYLEVEKAFPDQKSSPPYKKKRNQELSLKEEYNKLHSKKENKVEYIIY